MANYKIVCLTHFTLDKTSYFEMDFSVTIHNFNIYNFIFPLLIYLIYLKMCNNL